MPLGLPIDADKLVDVCRRYHVDKLELFGSRAKGTARPESDVDLLVTFAHDQTPGFAFIALCDELTACFGRDVDLLTRESVENDFNSYRRSEILETTEALYAA